MKWFINSMLWKVEKLWHKMGFGMIPDGHPDARPISREIRLPNGSVHIMTVDPDGRIHGLPGSPPEGLAPGAESLDAYEEKMKALGKW